MNREILYDAAFRYKKAGLWKKLWDSDLFAIKLKNGEIGYVSIMGRLGEYNAIALYIGNEGFNSYRVMANGRPTGSPFKDHEILIKQKCLQMALERKDGLLPEEVAEVRAYAKQKNIRLSGKNAYPQFIKYEPGCYPWKVQTEEDMDALYTALTAATLMADLLKAAKPEAIGIISVNPNTKDVPLFEVKGDQILPAGRTLLPGNIQETYEYAVAGNKIALASVKKLSRKGSWEAELVRLMKPVQNDPEEAPFFPFLLLIVESKSGYMLPVSAISKNDEGDQDTILQSFADAWKTIKAYPKEIRCRDERTYALLKDFCEKTDVKVSIYKRRMRALDEAEAALLDYTLGEDEEEEFDDQMQEVIDMILSMSSGELKMVPEPLIGTIIGAIEQGVFPRNIADELSRKLKILYE